MKGKNSPASLLRESCSALSANHVENMSNNVYYNQALCHAVSKIYLVTETRWLIYLRCKNYPNIWPNIRVSSLKSKTISATESSKDSFQMGLISLKNSLLIQLCSIMALLTLGIRIRVMSVNIDRGEYASSTNKRSLSLMLVACTVYRSWKVICSNVLTS